MFSLYWQDLKSPSEREGLAAARACLKQTSPLLYSSFMAYLQHPNITALQAGRESVHGEIQEAFAVISDAVQGIGCPMSKSITAVPSLAGAIDEFEVSKLAVYFELTIIMDLTTPH